LQPFERVFERRPRRAILHVLVEEQIGQGRDDHYVRAKRLENFRHAPDQLHQLKAGKRA
jgi:hypothetical protein